MWRLADPKISLASMASLLVGVACAWAEGTVEWGWFGVCFAGVFAIEVAKNASGEVFDWDSGVDLGVAEKDRSPFSGGKRVLVDGLLTRGETWGIAGAGYAVGIMAGLWIAAMREPAVIGVGLAGVGLAYFYHAPPLRLSYRGWGEAAVALAYGPGIACGVYLVLRGAVNGLVAGLSVGLGLLIAAFLVANEFPDFEADHGAGKRTLVVRLGRARGASLYLWMVLLAYLVLLGMAIWSGKVWLLLGLVGAPGAWRAARRLREVGDTTWKVIPAQVWSLQAFLLYAAGVAVASSL